MPSFTGTNLIDRAMAIADMHDSFVTTDQWLTWCTVGVAALDSIIDRSGFVYRESSLDLTIPMTNGEQSIANARAIIGIYEELSSGHFRRLRMVDPWKRARQRATLGTTGRAVEYYFSADTADDDLILRLWPRPLTGTYVMYYLGASRIVDSVNDTVNYPQGWEEYIVLYMASRALIKEESDPRMVQGLMKDCEIRIQEDCWSRLMAATPTIRNVDDVERGAPGYLEGGWPGVSEWYFV